MKRGTPRAKPNYSRVATRTRELPDMMSASEGGHGKADIVREVV